MQTFMVERYLPGMECVALREAVRAVAENKIAPHAAEVDDTATFPQTAYDALVASDFHAPHVPEEYGGVGADALATCIVIEEVARVCASSSLIPAVNKLGSLPLILAGSDELKAKYLPPLASGEAAFSYGLSEREAGSDTASMRCRAKADGDGWVLSGQKSWITNAGFSEYYTVLAVTDPDAKRGSNVSAFIVEKSDEGFSFGSKERKLGIKGSPTRDLVFDNVRIPGDRMIGAPGEGLKIALRTLDHTRVTIAAQAIGIAQGALDYALGYVQQRHTFPASSALGFSTWGKRRALPARMRTLCGRMRHPRRTRSVPMTATGTTGAPVSSARRPTPRLGAPSAPGRTRVPSGKIRTQSPRSRISRAVCIASASAWPRSIGKAPSEFRNHPWRRLTKSSRLAT